MKKVIKAANIPLQSKINNGFETVDYYDIYVINKKTDKNAEEVSKELIKLPNWVDALFKLRNSIVKIFGLNTKKPHPEKETFFNVIEKTNEEIVMGENDKHLNFRASIIIDRIQNTISLITLVHFNNIGGKLYFLPVKPFHKIIMRTLLKRYLNKK